MTANRMGMAANRMAPVPWLAAPLLVALTALAAHHLSPTRAPGDVVAKLIIAAIAITAVLYDRRHGANIPLRLKQLTALLLSAAALIAWFAPQVGRFPAGFHVPDAYHGYIGGKYFAELRYDGIYDCTTLAQDEAGRVSVPTGFIDVRAEIHTADFFARDLRNFRIRPATEFVRDVPTCRTRFSAERWQQFKDDVLLFRTEVRWEVWKAMQLDRGFTAPPFWAAVAQMLTTGEPTREKLTWLGRIDWLFLAVSGAALWWAFGWRTVALAAVFFGTQSFVTSRMIAGAFMRMDWLFLFILAVCCARKRLPVVAGIALGFATALRIFPALIVLSLVTSSAPAGIRSLRSRRELLRFTGSFVATAVALVMTSILATDAAAFRDFAGLMRTISANRSINQVGLPVVLNWSWPLVLVVTAALVGALVRTRRRAQPVWRSLAAGGAFLTLLPLLNLGCLYPAGFAPLARKRRFLEPALLGAAFLSTAASVVVLAYQPRFVAFSWIMIGLVGCVWLAVWRDVVPPFSHGRKSYGAAPHPHKTAAGGPAGRRPRH